MLHTRLGMGAVLIGLVVGVLVVDQWLAPWYPFLLVLVLGLGLASTYELLHLIGLHHEIKCWPCYFHVAGLLLANWLPHVTGLGKDHWFWTGVFFAGIIVVWFLQEMADFREAGQAVRRMASMVWICAYLGILPSFLVQLRWLPDPEGTNRGTLALALTIFVPKMCDTGAYFTGRLLGRHPMSPVLSPKKTWEGAAGGLVFAVLTAFGINRLGPALSGGWLIEVGFGLTVGVAGMLGDLAESLIKRDLQQKDASHMMPGFGGVLDVVDALLFAAPVAYVWLQI
jgi:phosphatidate cytidylyltransferase